MPDRLNNLSVIELKLKKQLLIIGVKQKQEPKKNYSYQIMVNNFIQL